MTHALTDDQIASYRDEGYLCPLPVFDEADAAALRASLEKLEATADLDLPRPLTKYLRMNSHLVWDMPLNVARDPRVVDPIESILGPDILLWSAEFFIKEAETRQIVSWHQDLTYWGMDGSDHEITAWLALSPATPASGCMKFVPGSHKHALVPHKDTFAADNLLSRGQEVAVEVDEDDAIAAALRPGQMSLHHGRLFHASDANTTKDRRIGLVMRFIRPDTPVSGARDFGMLVRGADRVGNRINVMPPPGDFSAGRLALFEEAMAIVSGTLSDGLESADEMYLGVETADA
jgi:ectoine hydroxylase-related dioxygenase (phytanoyl-CoA dioxygenase family)